VHRTAERVLPFFVTSALLGACGSTSGSPTLVRPGDASNNTIPDALLEGGDAKEPRDANERDGHKSGADANGSDSTGPDSAGCGDEDCGTQASDACTSGTCACGDSGLACTAPKECTGAGCTCVVTCDNGVVQRTDGTLWQYLEIESTPTEFLSADTSPFVARRFSSSYANLSCAVKADGTVWCWNLPSSMSCDAGSTCTQPNSLGQLGNGTTKNSPAPTQVVVAGGASLTDIRDVAVGESGTNACAIGTEGGLWCWGYTLASQSLYAVPVLTSSSGPPVTDVVQAASYLTRSCLRKSDGTVWCWGYGGVDGGTIAYPKEVTLPAAAIEMTADETSEMALTMDGHVWIWQDESLAPTELLSDGPTSAPLADVIHIQGEDNMACAEKSDNSLWCWGYGNPTEANVQQLSARLDDGGVGYINDVFALCPKARAPAFIDMSGVFYSFFEPATTQIPCP
jgi:hypothetical protein